MASESECTVMHEQKHCDALLQSHRKMKMSKNVVVLALIDCNLRETLYKESSHSLSAQGFVLKGPCGRRVSVLRGYSSEEDSCSRGLQEDLQIHCLCP